MAKTNPDPTNMTTTPALEQIPSELAARSS
jgi:hypothetical protein